jgi:hypothetical protein
LELSLLRFTQEPPGHSSWPAAHLASHTSSTHTSLAAHSAPVGHLVAHRRALHTCALEHRVVQSPQ